jgi:Holliday junction resolvase RusA-like endonuclease
MTITFNVIGTPVAQGSMKALGRSNAGHTIITHSNHATLKPWRSEVAAAALAARPDQWPLTTAITLSITFRFPRPAGHYRKDGTLKPAAPQHKTTKPDTDKLIRSILDALAGILYNGDQQVININAQKRFIVSGEAPGALITAIPHTD